ncbi:MAG: MXAN_5187 family protein [Myxococcota bacterium]
MLSRLWYLVLAVALGVALAGAFLNKSAASREAEFQLEEQLRRDRVEAELWLRLDARLRLDALAALAVEPEVRQTLRNSSNKRGTPPVGTRKRLSNKLNALNAKLEEGKGDMVFAVDAEGEVVATLDKSDMSDQRLDKMPLVRDALRGFMRDDVWVYNGSVYRMAARPVFDGGRYVGAIIHGMLIGDDLARRLGEKLPNATVVFFFGDELIAAHTGGASAPTRSEIKNGLAPALGAMGETDGSTEIGPRTRAIAAPVRGGASHAGVGYMVGRNGSLVGLGGLFANTFSEDVASLPWWAVIGIPLVLLLLGLALLYLEHDKAVGILRRSSTNLAKGDLDGLPAGELRRHYRAIAENVNTALRAGIGFKKDAEVRANVDLDDMLSSTRDEADTGYFGFGQQEAPTARRTSVEEASVATVTKGVPTARPAGTTTARPKETPTARPAVGKSSRPPAPMPRHRATPAPVRTEREPTPMPDDPPTRPRAIVDEYGGFGDDDGYGEAEESTQVTHIPQELLEKSSPGEEGEEAHFREVFEKFVETQKECGASVAGLTFEKFVRKLHAAREQVMKRHNAASVRFTVYVKEGRAALKASPVKR